MLTEDQWKNEFLALPPGDRNRVERQLRRKLLRYGGEIPPSEDLIFSDYVWTLYQRAGEAKIRSNAVLEKMVTTNEDGSLTLLGELARDPLSIRLACPPNAIVLSMGEEEAFFTELEADRLAEILENMARRVRDAARIEPPQV